MSEPDPADVHRPAHDHAHDHAHHHGEGDHDHGTRDGDDDDDDEPHSTGFLPLSLAISLFVTGLFVLGLVPGVQCG